MNVGGKNNRFTNLDPKGRVSVAVADHQLNESPSRLNPNQVLLRERGGGADHDKEYTYRDENYKAFRQNIEEAFEKYNKDGNDYLDKEEFKNFMLVANPKASPELLEEIYHDMDENGDEQI